jgi:hypothetical protein
VQWQYTDSRFARYQLGIHLLHLQYNVLLNYDYNLPGCLPTFLSIANFFLIAVSRPSAGLEWRHGSGKTIPEFKIEV